MLLPSVAFSALSTSHPRMMNSTWLATITANAVIGYEPYDTFFDTVTGTIGTDTSSQNRLLGQILLWKMGKGDAYRVAALAAFDGVINARTDDEKNLDDSGYMLALSYDLLYDELTETQQKNAVDKFVAWADLGNANVNMGHDYPLWNYQSVIWGPGMAIAAAAAGDPSNVTNDLAAEYANWKTNLWEDALTLGEHLGKGEFPEGTFYSTTKNWRYFLQATEVIYNAEGETTVFSDNDWMQTRLTWEWQTFGSTPKYYDSINSNRYYHYYHAWGHSERDRAKAGIQSRINTLILMSYFPSYTHNPQIFHSLYSNTDTELNAGEDDITLNSQVLMFLYSNKDAITPVEPSLQFWATNSGETYGPGKVFMREGYGDDDTYITYKSGDVLYRSHENFKEGSFQIYANGEDIAINSGTYGGSGEKDQGVNYFSRTVSSNSLIIYDKDEEFHYIGSDRENDGGQRIRSNNPQMAESFTAWLAQGTQEEGSGGSDNPAGVNQTASIERSSHLDDIYSYVFSDLTRAYNSDEYIEGAGAGNLSKVSEVTRELAFVSKKYVVVYDRVHKKGARNCSGSEAAGEPCDNQDKWLLHTQTTFSVAGTETEPNTDEFLYTSPNGSFDTTVNSAKMYGQVILPTSDYVIRRFTDTKRYWNYQRNVPITGTVWYGVDWGNDRIEIEPTDTNLDHEYLVVLFPATTSDSMPTVTGIDATGFTGVTIADATQPQVIIFSEDGDKHNTVSYTASYSGTGRHVVTGVSEGTYDITLDTVSIGSIDANADGVMTFTANSGDIVIASGGSGSSGSLQFGSGPATIQYGSGSGSISWQ